MNGPKRRVGCLIGVRRVRVFRTNSEYGDRFRFALAAPSSPKCLTTAWQLGAKYDIKFMVSEGRRSDGREEASHSPLLNEVCVAHRLRASLIFGLNNETALITGLRERAASFFEAFVFAMGE